MRWWKLAVVLCVHGTFDSLGIVFDAFLRVFSLANHSVLYFLGSFFGGTPCILGQLLCLMTQILGRVSHLPSYITISTL